MIGSEQTFQRESELRNPGHLQLPWSPHPYSSVGRFHLQLASPAIRDTETTRARSRLFVCGVVLCKVLDRTPTPLVVLAFCCCCCSGLGLGLSLARSLPSRSYFPLLVVSHISFLFYFALFSGPISGAAAGVAATIGWGAFLSLAVIARCCCIRLRAAARSRRFLPLSVHFPFPLSP